MSIYPAILERVKSKLAVKYNWLVTGAAGFIGSHLVEALLSFGQEVTGLDDFSTGNQENINSVLNASGHAENFRLIHGSITDIETCKQALQGVDYVLHHAALASVPESMQFPLKYHDVNASGFMKILNASRESNIKRVVYASSSAVYGDDQRMPKIEAEIGRSLSPYAMTKYYNEICAEFFARVYGLETVGLRYFNVFGPRQNPEGAYAAVIPKWIDALKAGKIPVIYGDGSAVRDFCSVPNVVLANILAAFEPEASGKVFNIGCGVSTSLNELLGKIYAVFAPEEEIRAIYDKPRAGDILLSSASIEQAQKILKFEPVVFLEEGLKILHDYKA